MKINEAGGKTAKKTHQKYAFNKKVRLALLNFPALTAHNEHVELQQLYVNNLSCQTLVMS